MACITLVTSTYNRSSVLAQVIRAVLCQSVTDWRWVIVGDACTDDTSEVVAGFDDPRMRFLNLPERFGEQAGPNSVGLALAETEFVALLNHDDLWLPDHLALALDALEHEDAALAIMRAAGVYGRGPESPVSFFGEAHHPGRTIAQAYETTFSLIEPMSAWVGRKAFFDDIGPMVLGSMIDVVPVQDYAMRVARSGHKVVFPDPITVLNIMRQAAYAKHAPWLAPLVAQIQAGDAAALRARIEEDAWLSAQLGAARPEMAPAPSAPVVPDGLVLHRDCGIDLPSLGRAAVFGPGWHLRRSLPIRTGETLEQQADLQEAIAFARRALD